jgi:hypothetical protein
VCVCRCADCEQDDEQERREVEEGSLSCISFGSGGRISGRRTIFANGKCGDEGWV